MINKDLASNDEKPLPTKKSLKDELYCTNCGEEENLKYNEQYANGECWTCKRCGEDFLY